MITRADRTSGRFATARRVVLFAAAGALTIAILFVPRVAQDPAYHDMADKRTILGVPFFGDVVSNLAFLIAGSWGLAIVRQRRTEFRTQWEIVPYVALFAGAALTAFGSAWYHLATSNERLTWDRLPMTAGFMGLLTSVIAERVGVVAARRLFVPLLVLGVTSVLWWRWSESAGRGDLRLYGLVQFGSLLIIALLLALYRPRYPGAARYLLAALALYAAAKVSEIYDRPIFAATGIASGHTLKHLLAAAGVAAVAMMLRSRRASAPPDDGAEDHAGQQGDRHR